MRKYKLICMSFDGEYVVDCKGTEEECENSWSNLGSKWFFYPFVFIVTESEQTIITAGGLFVDSKTKEMYMDMLYKGRRLKTVQRDFKSLYKYCVENKIKADIEKFEHMIISSHPKEYMAKRIFAEQKAPH